MKSKLIRFIFVLATSLMMATLGGCSIGMDSLEDILEKNNLSAQITYYANGGWFNDDTKNMSRDIYYKENSKAFEITDTTQTKIKHAEYVYDGWYTIETVQIQSVDYFVCDITEEQSDDFVLDENSVIVESEGKYVIKIEDYEQLLKTANVPLLVLDEPFDFATQRLAKDERLYLATKWVPNQKVEYVLITENCESVTVLNDDGTTKVVKNGEILASETFESDGRFTVPTDYNLSPMDSSDATFVDYYVYEEGASLDALVRLSDTTDTLIRPEDGSNIKVFVKYVQGKWKVIRFGEDVKSIFSSPSSNFYLSRDVDCTQLPAVNTVGGTFRGKICGNGYTVSGLKAQALKLQGGASVALFGTMGEGVTIENITFKDISLTCTTRPNISVNIYLLAHTLREGVTPVFNNVKFDGVTVDITLPDGASVANMSKTNTGYEGNTWLCKGYTNDAFFDSYETFQMENYKVMINNKTVATDK